MPDEPSPDYIPIGTLKRDAPARNRGYRYLSVEYATMRVTNEFEFSDVRYSFERNGAGELNAVLDLYSPDANFLKPQETFLVVERSGRPYWCGFMWQPHRNGNTLEIGALEVWSLFGHRHIRETKSFFNTDRAVIARTLVEYAQLGIGGNLNVETGIEVSTGPPLGEAFFPWWEDKIVASEIENLATIEPQFTFRIEGEWLPGNVLGFKYVIDPVHPVVSPHRLLYGGNVDDYEWEPISPSPNQVDAFGGFDGPAMLRRSAQNLDALNTQPRVELSVSNRDILSDQATEALAVSSIKKMSGAPAQPTVIMQASSKPDLGEIFPGYELEVDIDDGYVQVHGRFVVDRIEVAVPDGAADALGAETIRISFENIVGDESVGLF